MEQKQTPNSLLTPESLVADVLERWPQTIPIFLKYQPSCVGCSMAPFETLADAAEIYGLSLDFILRELEKVIREAL